MEKKVFKQGEVVFREGDLGSCFYQILEGTAGVYLNYGAENERRLTAMKPGEYFGEMAAITCWPRSTTIVAEDELTVIEIQASAINEYFTEQPDMIIRLMKQLSGRLRALTEEYEEVNAFLKEKKEAGKAKEEGFFARLKKYSEFLTASKKYAGGFSVEENLKMEKAFERKDGSSLPVRSFRRGEVIFREGEDGEYIYAVYSGSVGIYANYGTPLEKQLTTVYTNQFFGEMGLVEHQKRSATAVVEEDDTTLEFIGEKDLYKLFKENPMEVDMILEHLVNRLRRLTQDYVKACEEAVKA